MTLAKRIRDCRYAKGWGPDELAGRAQISRTALYQIECGKTETPRAGTLRRIAKALGVTTDALLGNEGLNLPHGEFEDAGSPVAEMASEWAASSPSRAAFDRPDFSKPETEPYAAWSASARVRELDRKFHELLDSPLGEGVARIVEDAYRLLPKWRGQ